MTTLRGSHRQNMDKEVQHSKSTAEALALLGAGKPRVKASPDKLTHAQADLFTKMRDNNAKICITGKAGLAHDHPTTQHAFKTAHMAQGREINRSPEFHKMPMLSKLTMLQSLEAGHFGYVSTHSDTIHHFYGLSESGLAALAKHQASKRQSYARAAAAAE